MHPEDDPPIVARVLGGERAAFRVLVERHQRPVFALLAAILPHTADREDVAQEAFLAAWRSLGTFDAARGTFAAWLLRIVRNRAFNWRRDRRPSAGGAAPERAAPPSATDGSERFARLDVALADLSDEQRVAFLLVEVFGLPLADVAEIEDVPLGTIKSRLGRALDRLRASLRCPVEPPR